MPLKLNYYYGEEADQFCFYRIPKALFTDASYKALSLEAKVLYGLLLDRMGLSVRNRKMDEQGRVFIFFKLETALDMLGIGRNKGVRLFKELELIGLIERKKQGQGKPAIIYVKNFIPPDSPLPNPPEEPDDDTGPEDGDSPLAGDTEDTEPGWNGKLWNHAALPEDDVPEPDSGTEDGAAITIVFPFSQNGGTEKQGGDSIPDEPAPDEDSAEAAPVRDSVDGSGADESGTGGGSADSVSEPPLSQTSQNGKSALPKKGSQEVPKREVKTSRNGTLMILRRIILR